jgi:hypothetical protein
MQKGVQRARRERTCCTAIGSLLWQYSARLHVRLLYCGAPAAPPSGRYYGSTQHGYTYAYCTVAHLLHRHRVAAGCGRQREHAEAT